MIPLGLIQERTRAKQESQPLALHCVSSAGALLLQVLSPKAGGLSPGTQREQGQEEGNDIAHLHVHLLEDGFEHGYC